MKKITKIAIVGTIVSAAVAAGTAITDYFKKKNNEFDVDVTESTEQIETVEGDVVDSDENDVTAE